MRSSIGYMAVILLAFSFIGYYSYGLLLNSARFDTGPDIESRSITLPLLAVDDNDDGLVIPLIVEVTPGTGKVLVNIDNPSFILDTQDSMRLAVREAAHLTGIDLSRYDIVFSLKSNISVIGGPSAGAAMTIATMAVLTDRGLKQDVAITGTIDEGGYIGQVGAIMQKAQAAKAYGIALLLVPVGESMSREPVENCTKEVSDGWSQKECFITYKTIDIAQEVGIAVMEVGTISEAMEHIIE